MPLIPQQDVIVIEGPHPDSRVSPQVQAVAKLKERLEAYPPARIVALIDGTNLHGYTLTAVIETV